MVKVPSVRSCPRRDNTTGPVSALRGTCTTIARSLHCATGASCPPIVMVDRRPSFLDQIPARTARLSCRRGRSADRLHSRNQFQRNGVADGMLNRRATGSVWQRIGRSQANRDVSRRRIGRHVHFDFVVLPASWPDHQVSHHHVVDAEHRVGITGSGCDAKMLAHNFDRMARFDGGRMNGNNFRMDDRKIPTASFFLPIST